MAKREDSFKDPVIVLAVDDIDATLQVVGQHGGSTAAPKMAVGDMGFAAYSTTARATSWGSGSRPPEDAEGASSRTAAPS